MQQHLLSTNPSQATSTSLPRIDFPSFNGRDSAEWIFKAKQLFKFHQILEQRKLTLISFHMEGSALHWYKCKNKMFFVMIENINDDLQKEETLELPQQDAAAPEISYHDLAGGINPPSDTQLQVLIDSGSTHNFVQQSIAQNLNLALTPCLPFKVYVGKRGLLP